MSYFGADKLAKVFLGDAGIAKAYLGDDLVFQNGPRIPAGFTELQYVTTDSNAYIDTGIAGALDLEVSIKASASTFVQYGAFYGNYIDESHKCCRIIIATATSLYVAGGDNLAQLASGFSIGNIYSIKVSRTEVYINNTRTAIPATPQTANSTNICLGNRNSSSPVNRDIGLRIYDFSIKKAGVLVLRYIPCKRDSDSVAGFYDTVAGAFVASETGTAFVAGPSLS